MLGTSYKTFVISAIKKSKLFIHWNYQEEFLSPNLSNEILHLLHTMSLKQCICFCACLPKQMKESVKQELNKASYRTPRGGSHQKPFQLTNGIYRHTWFRECFSIFHWWEVYRCYKTLRNKEIRKKGELIPIFLPVSSWDNSNWKSCRKSWL